MVMRARCDNCHKIVDVRHITMKSGLTTVIFVCDDCYEKHGLDRYLKKLN
jgi:lysyl-tRNA synthetase class I